MPSINYDFYVKVDQVVCWGLGLPREFLLTLDGNWYSEHYSLTKQNEELCETSKATCRVKK